MTKLLLLLLASSTLYSNDNIVYGQDNRLEYYQASKEHRKLADSVGGILYSGSYLEVGANRIMLKPHSIKRTMRLCNSESFKSQSNPFSCTFFLVGKDKVVTAGHCASKKNVCSEMKFVFDYSVIAKDSKPGNLISKNRVYSCKKILEQKLIHKEGEPKMDYAYIQLDREVKGRKPLRLRKKKSKIPALKKDTKLLVIGHPSGLPVKIASGAKVLDNTKKEYFLANLDTFGGNSGSPVFNLEEQIVEGILVRGQKDYVYDRVNKCNKVNKTTIKDLKVREGMDKGEAVSRLSQISLLN